jgi:hypothetical protein
MSKQLAQDVKEQYYLRNNCLYRVEGDSEVHSSHVMTYVSPVGRRKLSTDKVKFALAHGWYPYYTIDKGGSEDPKEWAADGCKDTRKGRTQPSGLPGIRIYIKADGSKTYAVEIRRHFDTLEEAIAFRNQCTDTVGGNC